jgi:hypothetical protein
MSDAIEAQFDGAEILMGTEIWHECLIELEIG